MDFEMLAARSPALRPHRDWKKGLIHVEVSVHVGRDWNREYNEMFEGK